MGEPFRRDGRKLSEPQPERAFEDSLRRGLRSWSNQYQPVQPAQLEMIQSKLALRRRARRARSLSVAGFSLAIMVAAALLLAPGAHLPLTKVNVINPASVTVPGQGTAGRNLAHHPTQGSAGPAVSGQTGGDASGHGGQTTSTALPGQNGLPPAAEGIPEASPSGSSTSNTTGSTRSTATIGESSSGSVGSDQSASVATSGLGLSGLPAVATVIDVRAGDKNVVVNLQPGQLAEINFLGSNSDRWGTPVVSSLTAATRLVSALSDPSGNATALVLALLPGTAVIADTQSSSCTGVCLGAPGVSFSATVDVG